MQNFRAVATALILALVAGAVGFELGAGERGAAPAVAETVPESRIDEDFLARVENIIGEKFFPAGEIPDGDALTQGAAAGMVAALGDPFSEFFDPEGAQLFWSEVNNEFAGIGAELGRDEQGIFVVAPLRDLPADRAGLEPRDRILTVDGEEIFGMNLSEVVRKIRGPAGTTVTLGISRADDPTVREVEITRAEIELPSIDAELRDGVLALTVRSFDQDTDREFARALDKFLPKKPTGILLDLRRNPGGYLDGAVQMLGNWLARGQVAVLRRFEDREEKLRPRGVNRLAGLPTAVLVDAGSASAAEIVAGALQDYGSARLFGEKTFGKGTVQEIVPLPGGSAMKITVAEWLTPKGRAIHGVGIEPDETVVPPAHAGPANLPETKDPVRDRALEWLRRRAELRAGASIAPTGE